MLLLIKALSLFCNKIHIIKIVYLHCSSNFIKRSTGCFTCFFTSCLKHIVNSRYIFLKFFSAISDRFKFFLKHCIQEFLNFHISKPTSLVMLLKFLKVIVIRQVKSEMFWFTECIKIGKYGITFKLTRILYT